MGRAYWQMLNLAPLLLALAAPLSNAADPTPEHEALAQRVDAVVVAAMADPAAVGLSVSVALGDEIILTRGYGLAEVEHDVRADGDTTFRIGSITKQFTAAAVMRLFEQEMLHVDEDMCVYLPDYPAAEEVVTIRNLLTHTSGIPSYTDLGPVFWENMAIHMTHEELLATFVDLPLSFPPGQRWAYNNSGYYLLGMVIESISGKTYAEYLQAELFEPLGLESMRYGSNSALIKNRAQGYRMSEGELHNDELLSMNPPGAAGALLACAGDLVRWQLALVSGKVVSEESYIEMTTPFMLTDMTETNYGMGLQLGERSGRTLVSHGGGISGFNSFLAHLPQEGLSVAVISNCEDFSAQGVANDILTAALEQ
ncbi:MAG: D-alanyl-D-alanine carboxypeptidase [Chlamydiales bacterium]|jgi:D-alanyl-D-alanine carboxypeptidase